MAEVVDSRRVRRLDADNRTDISNGPVVYVMEREQRVEDNWALLYACQLAHEARVGVMVLCVLEPTGNIASARHNEWMVASLQEVARTCAKAAMPFHIATGSWVETLPEFVTRHSIRQLVFDFNPLEPSRSVRLAVAAKVKIPSYEVDARNIIPCWEASDKKEFAAHTFRPKVHRQLQTYLTDYPKRPSVSSVDITLPAIDWESVRGYYQCTYSELVPETYTPGTQAGMQQLRSFLKVGLAGYADNRNDPTKDGVSHLSPYLRWGNISAQTVARKVTQADAPGDDKHAFLEELVVRRELTDNYVFYTEGYDTLAGAHEWAKKTLEEHRTDEREYVYTYQQFATANTHDPLWNAMQTQMVTEGKMHGWCRMYWAKKILEWTKSPEDAIAIALKLNDYYELDGRDSNGVVGVMWSICGVHDRAWTERPVFGKIRYMNYNGAKRKFPVAEYIARYGPQTESLL